MQEWLDGLDFQVLIDFLVTAMLSIVHLIMAPIDMILAKIPGIGDVAFYINAIGAYIGNLPSTMASLIGVNVILWNATFLVFVLFISLNPTVAIVKKIWAWVRP